MRLAKAVSTTTLLSVVLLTGCNSWMGEKEAPPLPGERVSVLSFDRQLQADPALAQIPMALPAAQDNGDWAFAGGVASHSGGSFSLGAEPREAWSRDVGDGTDSDRPLIATPVISNGVVYAMDSGAEVSAVNAGTGKEMWSVRVSPRRLVDKATGGGVALANGKLFATIGYGEVVALDPATGQELWRTATPSPLRGSPTSDGVRVYAVGIDNQLIAFSAASGQILWKHSGIAETTGLLGAPSPAIGPGFVLVAYSSGELYALNAENGRELWSDSLSGSRRDSGVLTIAAIRGMPALTQDGGIAVAISNSGRMVAIDTRSGQRLWDQRIGGSQMPWIAGDTVFIVDNTAQLTAINLRDGRIRWINQLAQWEDPKEHSGLIAWYGPVLAGGHLWLTNSEGRLIAYDPASGAEQARLKLGDDTNRPPVVAGGTLYTLDDGAELTAWR